MLVLDARDGLTAQDAHVAGYVVDEGVGLVLAINKWDLVEKDDKTFEQYVARIRAEAPFLHFAPVVAISALTGLRAGRVLDEALEIAAERRRRVPTARAQQGPLGRRLAPPAAARRRAAGRASTTPRRRPSSRPRSCSSPATRASVHFSYQRFLENRIRDAFDFEGTPLRLIFRERSRVELEPRAKAPQAGREGAAARWPARAQGRRRHGKRTGQRQLRGRSAGEEAAARREAGPQGPLMAGQRAPSRGRRRRRLGHHAGHAAVADAGRSRSWPVTRPRPSGCAPMARNERHLPGVPAGPDVVGHGRPGRPGRATELVVAGRALGRAARHGCAEVAAAVPPEAVLLSVVKGLEGGTLLRMSQVIAEEVPGGAGRVAALSGPNLAPEIARGLPAAAVVAADGRGRQRTRRGARSAAGPSGSTATATSSAWSWPARSRTSWPSWPAPSTSSGPGTTPRPPSRRAAWRR